MADKTSINFYRGESFSSYEPGAVYFEESTHLVKVATSASSASVYSGVQSAILDSETGILTIVNESGDSIVIDFGGYATESYVDEKIGDINTILESVLNDR